MSDLRISQEAFCLDALDMDKVRRNPVVVKTIDADGEVWQRKCSLIKIGERQYWADRVTGTLYRMDGSCPSSEKLKMLDPK
jgi:hypothetical protein